MLKAQKPVIKTGTAAEESAEAPLHCARASTDFVELAAARFAPMLCGRASTAPVACSRASTEIQELADVKFNPITWPITCSGAGKVQIAGSQEDFGFQGVNFGLAPCSRTSTEFINVTPSVSSRANTDFEELAAAARASTDSEELAAVKPKSSPCPRGTSSGIVSGPEENLVCTLDTDTESTETGMVEEREVLSPNITVKNTFVHISGCTEEEQLSRSKSVPARLKFR